MIGSMTDAMTVGVLIEARDAFSGVMNRFVTQTHQLESALTGLQDKARRYSQTAARLEAAGHTRMAAALRSQADLYATRADLLERQTRRTQGAFRMMGLGIGVGAMGFATVKSWIESAGEFHQALADVATVAGDDTEALKVLGNEARNVSQASLFPASEILRTAGYNLISAGMSVEQATGALKDASDLAVGGMGDLEQASQVLGTAFNTFGVDTQRAADVFAATVATFQTKLPLLYEGFKYAAGSASTAGIAFEETAAALGMLQTRGLDASRAGTGLNAVLRQLPKAEKELNIQTRDAVGNALALADILAQLEKRYGDSIDSTREQAELQRVFGEEGYRALVALYGQSDALRGYTASLNRSGAAAKMARIRMQGYEGQVARFRNEMNNLKIQLGENLLPALTTVLATVGKMAETFGKLPKPIRDLVSYGTAIGSLVLPIAGVVNYLVQWRRQAIMTKAAMELLNRTTGGGVPGVGGAGAPAGVGRGLGAAAGGAGLAGSLALGAVAVGTGAAFMHGESLGRKTKLSWWEQGLSVLGPWAAGRSVGTGLSAYEYLKRGGSVGEVLSGKWGLGPEAWSRALEEQKRVNAINPEEATRLAEAAQALREAAANMPGSDALNPTVIVQIDGKEIATALAREHQIESRRIP